MDRHFVLVIATRQRVGVSGVRIHTGPRQFFLLRKVQIGYAAQAAPMQYVLGVFAGVKAAGGWMSITSRAEVKNEWSHTSAPPYALMAYRGMTSCLCCNLLNF
jgi:hypothetical protein